MQSFSGFFCILEGFGTIGLWKTEVPFVNGAELKNAFCRTGLRSCSHSVASYLDQFRNSFKCLSNYRTEQSKQSNITKNI